MACITPFSVFDLTDLVEQKHFNRCSVPSHAKMQVLIPIL